MRGSMRTSRGGAAGAGSAVSDSTTPGMTQSSTPCGPLRRAGRVGRRAGFGSRRPWRDAPIGFALALGTFFGFARALGVNIGMGPFERALIAALGI